MTLATRIKQLTVSGPRSKYGAVKTRVDGILFHSKGEAKRWGDLRNLERANLVTTLKRQVKFPLTVNGVLICDYIADFTYWNEDREFVVEDFKGFRTPEYQLKAKLFRALYPNWQFIESGAPKTKRGPWVQRRRTG